MVKNRSPELKVYLREELLTQILDNLVSTVSRQDPETLRQLAATLAVEIARLTRLREIVGVEELDCDYFCNYGMNGEYEARFAEAGMRVCARGKDGEIRAMELEGQRFYVLTLFQPQLASSEEIAEVFRKEIPDGSLTEAQMMKLLAFAVGDPTAKDTNGKERLPMARPSACAHRTGRRPTTASTARKSP